MNIATEAFRFARRCAERPIWQRPLPHAVYNDASALTREFQPRYLLLGAERQFHDQAGFLCDLVVSRLLDYRDRVWKQQRNGLIELLARFFRRKSSYPALAWASPIWMRTQGAWQRAGEGKIITQDETAEIRRRGTTAAYSSHHRLRFAGGESVKVNVKELAFFYPQPSTALLHVPRYRKLYTATGKLLEIGYEEGLGLGAAGEKRALRAGNYTPNELFFRSTPECQSEWLDLRTVTLARFSPESPPDDESLFRFRLSDRLAPFPSQLARGFDRFSERPGDDSLPQDATVRFLRITFAPEDFKTVVLLAAERELPRFLVEHDGLAQLLVERLVAERMRA